MAAIKDEIVKYLTGLVCEDGAVRAQFLFPPEFIGFQGHFPGKMILPGVCQVQCALAALEQGTGRSADLRGIAQAKYLSPVLPGEEITCTCGDGGQERGEVMVKAVITKGGSRVSEMKLKVLLGRKAGS